MLRLAKDIRENRHALHSQFYVNIKTTVATTKLGLLWWILDPLFLMLIYYFVVKVVFNRGGENYHLFLLCGLVTWQSFSRAIALCTRSLTNNEGLIKQASLPMVIYVMISPLVQAFFYTIGLVIIMIWNWPVMGLQAFAIVFPVLLMILVSFSAGLFLSVFEVYIRDTGKLITYILRFGMYMSPVLYGPERIYQLESVPAYAKFLYSLNPMVHVIGAVRDLLFYGKMFEFRPMFITFVVTLLFMQVGLVFFRKVSPYVPKML
ncbi:MAG: ABC transporter permease [Desulfobacteraceae bacterium]|jgi:lipopolysaccharide transport system permease protein|nr:ABC transporter permease [Desulfobacteraceae bacterium]